MVACRRLFHRYLMQINPRGMALTVNWAAAVKGRDTRQP
jgi:hypothetical protein